MLTHLRKRLRDRRKFDRVQVTGCVALLRKGGLLGKLGFGPLVVGEVIDLGPGGACIRTNAALKPFDVYEVSVQRQVGEGGLSNMRGRTVWARRDPGNPAWTLIGVEFSVDAARRQSLGTFARAYRSSLRPTPICPHRLAV